MLDDPEAKTERWSQYILANSPDEARKKCELIAENAGYTTRVVDIRKTSKNPNRRQYECIFEVESDPLGDDEL
jgi:hypothetical protein